MQPSTAEIKNGLERAIKNCNRNLYEWLEKNKRGSIYTISYTEANGLVKNWIKRCMKDVVGSPTADRVLKEGNLVVAIDEKSNSIERLNLTPHRGHWKQLSDHIDMFQKCFDLINFKALRYDPNDYLLDGTTEKSPGITHPALLDLTSIDNIKFQ